MLSRRAVAHLVTEIFAPAPVAATVLCLVAWHSTSTMLEAVAWGVLTVLLTIVPPLVFLLRGVRRGRFTDRHVRLRQQRPLPLLAGIGSVLLGLALLSRLGAPQELLALVVAMGVGLVVALVTNACWKLSLHVGSVAGAVVILVLVFGPALLLLTPLVVLVGWARVELSDHTPAEVIGGAAIGMAVAASVFQVLR